jgi:hypothetical protein
MKGTEMMRDKALAKSRHRASLSLIALGAGLAASALLGPLVLRIVEFRVSASAENQLLGGEIVSLFPAAVPLITEARAGRESAV